MYITVEELIRSFSKQVLVQLSNDDNRATEIDTQVVIQAITTASERIDVALRSRYQLPLSDTPTLIANLCLSLARYWLYSRRAEMKVPETVKDTYNQALKELEQIARGVLHLGIKSATSAESTESATSNAENAGDLLPDSGEYRVKSTQRIDTRGY